MHTVPGVRVGPGLPAHHSNNAAGTCDAKSSRPSCFVCLTYHFAHVCIACCSHRTIACGAQLEQPQQQQQPCSTQEAPASWYSTHSSPCRSSEGWHRCCAGGGPCNSKAASAVSTAATSTSPGADINPSLTPDPATHRRISEQCWIAAASDSSAACHAAAKTAALAGSSRSTAATKHSRQQR